MYRSFFKFNSLKYLFLDFFILQEIYKESLLYKFIEPFYIDVSVL
jgi:hypothetical protein